MPQRTNDFQELVVLIQRALAPADAVVTESALVESVGEGETREIDVLIETKVCDYRIRIAVEAKDEGRPMDQTKFEAIIGKYFGEGGVKVNKVVVVTHHGFYQPVIERARKLDIDLLTLQEARQIDWSLFKPPGPAFECSPKIQNIRFITDEPASENIGQNGRIVCSCGRHYGTPLEFASRLFIERVMQSKADELIAIDRVAAGQDEGKKAHIEMGGLSNKDHERRLVAVGESRIIEGMSFDVHFQKRTLEELTRLAQIRFAVAPHICQVTAVPEIVGVDPKEVSKSGHVICSCCSKDYGTISSLATKRVAEFLKSSNESRRILENTVRQSANGQAYLDVAIPMRDRLHIAYDGKQHPIDRIIVRIHAVAATAPMELKQYELRTRDGHAKTISHFEATVAGKKLRIMMPEGIQSKQICLKIDNAASDHDTHAPIDDKKHSKQSA